VAEQALRCAPVDAVLLWLAQARPQELRRLQLAAAQHHKLLFVMRPSDAAYTASPAVLRVQIAPCATHATGLRVEILKRRGPPLAQALHILPAQGQLAHVLAAADTAPSDSFADAPALDRAAA
jgi:protein ImuA